MTQYRVYVLQNPKGKFYVGLSENIPTRVQQHNTGLSRSTRGRGPWRVVWQSDGMNLANARQLELAGFLERFAGVG